MAKKDKNICAVFIEPIQGEGGINIPNNDYLKDLRSICSEEGWLLMLDEVQTGNGRTGHYFCYQESDVIPDVVTTSKGLGNGFPIGACLTAGFAKQILKPGSHGSTFGGNPLAMAVGNAVIDIVSSKKFLKNVNYLSKHFLSNLNQLKEKYPKIIKEIRGKGLLIGIQLHKEQAKFIKKMMDKKVLTIRAAENVVRILPPLNVKKSEINHAIKIINQVCKELKK